MSTSASADALSPATHSHTAFELLSVTGVTLSKPVTALAVYGPILYVAIQSRLLVYSLTYDPSSRTRFYARLDSEYRTFGRRITQLIVCASLNVLVSLGDGQIKVSTLGSEMRDQGFVTDAKGRALKNVTLMSLKQHRGHHQLLAVSRRDLYVMLFDSRTDGSWFHVIETIRLDEVPRSVTWAGDQALVGFQKCYQILPLRSSRSSSASSSTSSRSMRMSTSSPPPQPVVISVPNPQAATLSLPTLRETMVKIHKRVLTFSTEDGRPTRTHPIDFSGEPRTLSFLQPYLVASVGTFIEIQLLDPDNKRSRAARASGGGQRPGGRRRLPATSVVQQQVGGDMQVQTIALDVVVNVTSQPNFVDLDSSTETAAVDTGIGLGFRAADPDPDDDLYSEVRLFVAARNSVYVLVMRKFALQIKEIQRDTLFPQALHLASILERTPYRIPKQRVDEIHVDYGFHLFLQRSYILAMHHFGQTDKDPRLILSLFGRDLLGDDVALFPLPYGNERERRQAVRQLSEGENRANALRALIDYLKEKRIEVDEEEAERVMQRQRERKQARRKRQRLRLGSEDEELRLAEATHRLELATAIDTALFTTLLLLNDNQLRNFLVHTPNRCDVGRCETLLRQHHKFEDLIEFYKSKKLHRQALTLLKGFGTQSHPLSKDFGALTGVDATIRYLRDLRIDTDFDEMEEEEEDEEEEGEEGETNDSSRRRRRPGLRQERELVREFSRWALTADHAKAVEIFTHHRCPFSTEEVLTMFDKDVFRDNDGLDHPSDGSSSSSSSASSPSSSSSDSVLMGNSRSLRSSSSSSSPSQQEIAILEMKIRFLEYLIESQHNRESKIHNLLILLYEQHIETCEQRQSTSHKLTVMKMKKKLRRFLKASRHYVPSQILSRFPANKMFKERAILLSKLNRHEEALNIYIHDLPNQKSRSSRPSLAAEKYCLLNYDPEDPDRRDIFLTLLRLNLRPKQSRVVDRLLGADVDSSSSSLRSSGRRMDPLGGVSTASVSPSPPSALRLEDSIRMMEKYSNRMELTKVIDILPEDVEVSRLRTFFTHSLREHVRRHRNARVLRRMAYSLLLQTQNQYTRERRKCFVMGRDSKCVHCGRKIGLSAFRYDPELRKVSHLNCGRRRRPQ